MARVGEFYVESASSRVTSCWELAIGITFDLDAFFRQVVDAVNLLPSLTLTITLNLGVFA